MEYNGEVSMIETDKTERICKRCGRIELTFHNMVEHWNMAHNEDMIKMEHPTEYYIKYVRLK